MAQGILFCQTGIAKIMRWRDILLIALLMLSAPAFTEFLIHQIGPVLDQRNTPDKVPAASTESRAILVEKNQEQNKKSTVVSNIVKAGSK